MPVIAYDPFLLTFGLSAFVGLGLCVRIATLLGRPVVQTLLMAYALVTFLFSYPLLFWYRDALSYKFSWAAVGLIVVAMLIMSSLILLGSLFVHPWENESAPGMSTGNKLALEQMYPDCRVKRLHSGQWLLTSRLSGKTVGIIRTPGSLSTARSTQQLT